VSQVVALQEQKCECENLVTSDDDVICAACGEHSEIECCEVCDESYGTSCCGAGSRF
jgi:hypothetical protein